MTDISFETPQQFELTAQREQSALDVLAEGTGLSKQRIKDAMNKGAVWWTQKGKTLRLRRATKMISKGTKLQLFYDPQVLACKPETPQLILDAEAYSIWYKPAGMLSQGSQWGDHCSILRWVEVNARFTSGKSQRECYLVHRLDADASGLIILAHHNHAAAKLSALFQARDMRKFYQAWVVGEPLMDDAGLSIRQELDGKAALTHIKKIQGTDNKTLLDVHIETGRKHQIRRHLASIGHPIIGDRLYGSKANSGLQLLAYRLEFACPFTGKQLRIELNPELQFKH